jgi:hypothetical protein
MKKPTEDFTTRFDAAKRWRDAAKPFINEIFRFTCPGREHDFDRKSVSEYETDVFISLGEELARDLAGDIITYYTPGESKWATYLVTAEVPEDQKDAVLELVQGREDQVAEAFQLSNYYDISPQWAFEAASHGTPALWVQKSFLSGPLHFEVVPPHELFVTPGYLGILDRFRETSVLYSAIAALFQGWDVDLNQPKLKEKLKKPGSMCKVCWGFWLDWKDPGNPRWRCEITVDGIRITPEEPLDLGGIYGSCPLLIGRFNPQPGKPWGRGPGWTALPDLRVLDKVDEIVLSGMDQSISTTLIYADDGMLDLSEGLEAGRAYPANRGFTREKIYDLSRSVNVDQGWFAEERIEERIRRAFYQDGPRQRGDTPPTASQWLDERRRVQARLGKPSAPLWSELILPMIQRVEYLLVQSGDMPEAISHNGNAITVKSISPLQKSQNQDQVMIARSNLELAFSVLGEGVGQVVDLPGSFSGIVKQSGDTITKILPEQQQQQQQQQPMPAQ